MELKQLRQFLAVFEHRHYGRAAEELGLSQSALTKGIAKLEKSLRVQLFERGRHGATPTTFGEALAHRAKIIISEEKIALYELESLYGGTLGQVVFGMGFSCAHRIVPEAVSRFSMTHPNVAVTAVEAASAELLDQLLQGSLDFVVSSPPGRLGADREFVAEPIYADRDFVVASACHPIVQSSDYGLRNVAKYPWAVSDRYAEVLTHIQKAYAAAGLVGPHIAVKTDSTSLMRALVRRGDYLCLMSKQAFEVEPAGLYQVDCPPLELSRIGYLISRRRSRPHPTAAAFLETLKSTCRELFAGSA